MSFAQFPIVELHAIAADLVRVESVLSAPKSALTEISGLGTQQQQAVQDAITEFHDEWKTSTQQLIDNIGNWGTTAAVVAARADGADQAGSAVFDKLAK
ncbi:hypothetical protein [Nocardia sp. NPDC058497]|uniref:hypothetical protein n=1 Tax=Nocardia sp. NPDC058497 TaxID=3346529 RepID=UPI00364F3D33